VTRRKNRRKLRNFIVNKKQLLVAVGGTVYIFLSLAVVLAVIIGPVYSDIFKSSEVSLQRESAKDFILLSDKLVIALSAIFVFSMVPLIWLTHRLFGPLINFANIFKRVSLGDLTAQVYLRRGDLLKGEARLVNDMIQSLRQTISEVRKQNQQLVKALGRVAERQRVGQGPDDDLLETQKQALACEELLAKFTIDEFRDNMQP
jgi:methyl-accepting chemotaxis protein